MEEVLFYPCAGWDLSFPLYPTTILVDQQPLYSYWSSEERSCALARHYLAVLQNLMVHAFPGCRFCDVPSERVWKWIHPTQQWTIYYFYNLRLGQDPLPNLVRYTTILWLGNGRLQVHPAPLLSSLPALRTITGPALCSTDLCQKYNHPPTRPVSVLSHAELANLQKQKDHLFKLFNSDDDSKQTQMTDDNFVSMQDITLQTTIQTSHNQKKRNHRSPPNASPPNKRRRISTLP